MCEGADCEHMQMMCKISCYGMYATFTGTRCAQLGVGLPHSHMLNCQFCHPAW
jgi:hypothetical protein